MNLPSSSTTVVSPYELTEAGALPFWNEAVRFAVGDPAGLSSNTWRVWMQGAGDVYLACRDTLKETKVSLHVSGRWRFGFTSEAAAARPDLIAPGADRAMEVWDKPAEIADGVIQAFKIYFPSNELLVTPEKRTGAKWKNVIFVEQGPADVATVMAVYVCTKPKLLIAGIRAFTLGSWSLPDGSFAHLVAQAEPFNNEQALNLAITAGKLQAQQAGIEIPKGAILQFWGIDHTTGSRWTVVVGDP